MFRLSAVRVRKAPIPIKPPLPSVHVYFRKRDREEYHSGCRSLRDLHLQNCSLQIRSVTNLIKQRAEKSKNFIHHVATRLR